MYGETPSTYGLQADSVRVYTGAIALMYGWIAFGLTATTIAAWLTRQLAIPVYIGLNGFLVIGGVTLLLMLSLSFAIRRLPAAIVALLYCACAMLVGVSVSCILGVYTTEAIVLPIAIIASLFALMSATALATGRDLSKWWAILLFGLLG